jgi:hypothetical protein
MKQTQYAQKKSAFQETYSGTRSLGITSSKRQSCFQELLTTTTQQGENAESAQQGGGGFWDGAQGNIVAAGE